MISSNLHVLNLYSIEQEVPVFLQFTKKLSSNYCRRKLSLLLVVNDYPNEYVLLCSTSTVQLFHKLVLFLPNCMLTPFTHHLWYAYVDSKFHTHLAYTVLSVLLPVY